MLKNPLSYLIFSNTNSTASILSSSFSSSSILIDFFPDYINSANFCNTFDSTISFSIWLFYINWFCVVYILLFSFISVRSFRRGREIVYRLTSNFPGELFSFVLISSCYLALFCFCWLRIDSISFCLLPSTEFLVFTSSPSFKKESIRTARKRFKRM